MQVTRTPFKLPDMQSDQRCFIRLWVTRTVVSRANASVIACDCTCFCSESCQTCAVATLTKQACEKMERQLCLLPGTSTAWPGPFDVKDFHMVINTLGYALTCKVLA